MCERLGFGLVDDFKIGMSDWWGMGNVFCLKLVMTVKVSVVAATFLVVAVEVAVMDVEILALREGSVKEAVSSWFVFGIQIYFQNYPLPFLFSNWYSPRAVNRRNI